MDFSAGSVRTQDAPARERVKSMLSCIEGAITMYRNSPPELQQAVLVTLRAALLSAVHTCNAVLADNDVASFAATLHAPRTPTQFTDVVPETAEEQMEKVSMYGGSDENSQFLETVFEKLKNARGDGKMGLRKDLAAADAESLADDINRMRAMLVEELESGIPEATSPTRPTRQDGTASKYQEMLARARAEKEANNK
jgi:hypothetical protein